MLLGERGMGVSGVGVGFAAGDGGAAQVLDGLVERQARLLAQDFAQQRAETWGTRHSDPGVSHTPRNRRVTAGRNNSVAENLLAVTIDPSR
jgi:hypothetical protein